MLCLVLELIKKECKDDLSRYNYNISYNSFVKFKSKYLTHWGIITISSKRDILLKQGATAVKEHG